jgi:hypothetical protein
MYQGMRCTSVTTGETSATRAMLVIKLITTPRTSHLVGKVIDTCYAWSNAPTYVGRQAEAHSIRRNVHLNLNTVGPMNGAFGQPHSMDYELAARTEVSTRQLRVAIVQSQLTLKYQTCFKEQFSVRRSILGR